MRYAFFDAHGKIVESHDDQTITDIPEGAIELDDEQWSARFDLRVMGKALVIDRSPVPVARLKNEVWNRIQAERDRRTDQGGYKVGAKWFPSDMRSRLQQLGLALLGANIPAGIRLKTMDGSFVVISQALSQQILAASVASDQAIATAAETHKTAMEASSDPSGYDFSAGWPKSFGE